MLEKIPNPGPIFNKLLSPLTKANLHFFSNKYVEVEETPPQTWESPDGQRTGTMSYNDS